MRIVVVGGSGRVGAKLVENLRHRGSSSRNLLAGAEAARVKHHIVLSIVGTDRLLESGYFRAKMRQEELARESLIPHTILRSTQFFEFMPTVTGPECFRLDDAVLRVMQVTRDSRAVIADPHARYFGAKLREDTLTPDEGAIIGVGRFNDWLEAHAH